MTDPTVEDFTSAPIVDRFDDMISLPGLTNHVVVAQVDHDVAAVRSVNMPPVSQGDCVTGRLYLDGKLAQSSGEEVMQVWRPDRVVRSTTINGWQVETVTVVPPRSPGVLVRLAVTNAGESRDLELGLWLDSQVVKAVPWHRAEPPRGYNTLERSGSRRRGIPATPPKGMEFAGALEPTANVSSLQGLVNLDGSPIADRSEHDALIKLRTRLETGNTWEGAFILVVGDEGANLDTAFEAMASDIDGAIAASTNHWNRVLKDLFEADSEFTSGALPKLETSNEALRQLYWWGAMGTAWFRREIPSGIRARHYDTLMPRYWQTTTFIWDYSLSSLVHALTDPEEMREQILHWIGLDINEHFGTEWLTGGPAGNWYSVNQYAMVRLVHDYVTVTGDTAFLDEPAAVGDTQQTVGDHVRAWSVEWRNKRVNSPLADYGEIDNLLECVSTYVHEVASLNAANVWCMRTAAELSRFQGLDDEARRLEELADELIPEILKLYRKGEGYFNARHPDGTLVPVGHCYDFSTVGTTIASDLPDGMRDEMLRFFDKQLKTESWMHALAPSDANAGFSLRPDHQWNGAYPAWPADSARAAVQLGGSPTVARWIHGLARSANQGPPGQAHFVEEAIPGIGGGARKAPPQYPYLIDWACSSAGAWCELIMESVFGVQRHVDGSVTATPNLEHFDPDARLTGLRIAGHVYDIDRNGIHRVDTGDDH